MLSNDQLSYEALAFYKHSSINGYDVFNCKIMCHIVNYYGVLETEMIKKQVCHSALS
jgi:hypothetical protein